MLCEDLNKIGQQLKSWPRTLLLSHRRPDGDALGALTAMQHVITTAGRTAEAHIESLDFGRYGFLHGDAGFVEWNPAAIGELDDRFDGICIVDTCSWSQLEPFADFLRATTLPKVVIDHHATRETLSADGEDGPGDLYFIDPTAASACGMVYRLCDAMGWSIDLATADALFAGLATDTGWFRYSNTDHETLNAAACLLDQGVQPHRLYGALYETLTPERLKLKAKMLQTLELHANDSLAITYLTKAMFDETGATLSDTEDLVNEPMQTGSVVVSVMMTDLDNGEIRANFRSKPPEVCGKDVDVAAVAGTFGGGGHRRAAGARLDTPLSDARDKILAAVLPQIQA